MQKEIIDRSIEQWTADPESAKAAPVVKARSEGPQALIEAGPFSFNTDLPPALGGENQAASPTALLLSALAGCAAAFIRDTIAPQLGVEIESVEAEVRAKVDYRALVGMQGAKPDIEGLEIDIDIRSPNSSEEVQAVYEAWRERCPVFLALIKPVEVKTNLKTGG